MKIYPFRAVGWADKATWCACLHVNVFCVAMCYWYCGVLSVAPGLSRASRAHCAHVCPWGRARRVPCPTEPEAAAIWQPPSIMAKLLYRMSCSLSIWTINRCSFSRLTFCYLYESRIYAILEMPLIWMIYSNWFLGVPIIMLELASKPRKNYCFSIWVRSFFLQAINTCLRNFQEIFNECATFSSIQLLTASSYIHLYRIHLS